MQKKTRRKTKRNVKHRNEMFRSSKYLMSFVLDEYSKEFIRNEKLDGKGMALMTLLIGFLTLTFPTIDFGFIVNSFYMENNNIVRLGLICIVFLLVSLFLTIYTLVNILKIYKVRCYKRFNTNNAKDRDIENKSEEIVAASMIDTYADSISYNQNINNDKANLIEKAYRFVIISIILILLTTILTILGGKIMENELKNNLEKIEKEIETANVVENKQKYQPVNMEDGKILMHCLTVKDAKPIKESND